MDQSLEKGKIYSWKSICSTYPNMWAIMTDVKRDENNEITECKLLDIVPFENRKEVVDKYWSQGIPFEYERTTPRFPMLGGLFYD